MQPSLRVGRLAGIEIGIHYTWLLIAVLITASFFGYFSSTYAHWPRTNDMVGGHCRQRTLFLLDRAA